MKSDTNIISITIHVVSTENIDLPLCMKIKGIVPKDKKKTIALSLLGVKHS